MITVTISGFKTIEEAKQWCSAYEGGVEQDMSVWAEGPNNTWKFPFNEKSTKATKDNVHMVLTHPDEYPKQK